MADEGKDPNYALAGHVVRDDLFKETEPGVINEGDLRPVNKCLRCGAMILGGGLTKERHDQFHDALSQLWEMVASQQES